VRFLIDRCAGGRLAEWLRREGHDAEEVSGLGPDPGDQAILERAKADRRVLITIDTDFGFLVYAGGLEHAGLVRLPDVPAARRIEIVAQLLESHAQELVAGAVITVKGGRIRISHPNPRG
jgi:predicted nuclease of predicted toxin-antitoxin system